MLLNLSWLSHAEDNPVVDAMAEYMDFASYADGTITKQQIESLGVNNMFFIDARKPDFYEKSHIEGAVNIEWRQILQDLNAIPTDKTVVLYCDSGLLSSKAHFALRLAGYENVRVLLGGYAAWQK
jgi:rhodanese-related sulfurtransferase